MSTKYAFIFPNGDCIQNADMEYCPSSFHIGEMFFFEGQKAEYRVSDIQHQFRPHDVFPRQIMVLVILVHAKKYRLSARGDRAENKQA